MRNLTQFLKFDAEAFLKDKSFLVIAVKEWLDFETKKKLGTAVETVITKDDTPYRTKDGKPAETNRFEKIIFKVSKDVDIPLDSYIKAVNPTATVYGEYRNLLSLKCDDIQVLQPRKGAQ